MVVSRECDSVNNLTGILILGGSNLEGFAAGRLRLVQIYKLDQTEELKKLGRNRP